MAEDSRETGRHDLNGDEMAQNDETVEMISPAMTDEESESLAMAQASKMEAEESRLGLCEEGADRGAGEAYCRLQGGTPAPHTTGSKYTNSLKILIPYRLKPKKEEYCPLDHCGLLSFVWLSWMSPLFYKAYKRSLEYSDLWRMSDYDRGGYNGKRFERLWEEEVERRGEKDASLGRVAFLFIRTRMIVALLALVISTMATFITAAVLVERLLRYTESEETDVVYGVVLVIAIFFLNLVRICGDVFFWAYSCRTALRLRSGSLALAFSRLAHLRSLREHSVGEIVNVCAIDSQRLFEGCIMGNFLISSIVMLVAATIATQLIIGTGALIGTVCTFLLFFPIQMFLGHIVSSLRIKTIAVSDKRVQKMNEILTYIKLIKMYAWEKPFAKTIAGIRAVERRLLEKAGFVQSYSISIIPAVPTLASVSSILIHVAMGNSLTASEAFTLVALLNVLRVTIGPTPFAVRMLGESSVALTRLKKIITLDRMEPNPRLKNCQENVVEIRDGTFAWDVVTGEKGKKPDKGKKQVGNKMDCRRERKSKSNGHKYEEVNNQCNNHTKAGGLNGVGSATPMMSPPDDPALAKLPSGLTFDPTKFSPALLNIDFHLKRSKLTGVCGMVGSGKTSLITAILGEMQTLEGACHVSGSFAYVAQEAWIFNGSLRENILFGQELEAERYEQVLDACCLRPDLDILNNGDQTEIGERGINLSGGQKQRVSLARAVYSNRDVYLLDDPLSAVDAHVGEHIFTRCIRGILKDKTVMFVSHQLQYLKECESIAVMADGRIAEQGNHGNLMAQEGEYARLITTHYTKQGDGVDSFAEEQASKQQLIRQMKAASHESTDKGTSEKAAAAKTDGDLTTEEDRGKSDGMWRVYHGYVQAMGGYLSLLLMLFSFLVLAGLLTFSNWWLSYWIDSTGNLGMNTTFAASEEDGAGLSEESPLGFYMMVYGFSLLLVFVLAIFKSFIYMKLTLKASSALLSRLFHTVLRSPVSFFDTTPTGRILNRFSKDIDELDVMLPVNADIALSNLVVIFASLISITVIFPYFLVVFVPIVVVFCLILVFYRRGVNELKQLENVSRSPWFSMIGSTAMGLSTIHAYNKTQVFITKFLELLDVNAHPMLLFRMSTRWAGARMELLVVMVITVTNLLVVLKHGSVPPAMAGLAVSYAMQLTGLFQFTLCMIADAEARFLSAQRILNYTKNLKSEAPDEIPKQKPEASWPSKGVIQFQDFKMRYRDNLPLVLKGISCNIQAGERIGIVGRTGSGKSSLGVGLFRLVEPSEGSITIDGIKVGELGLTDLRSRISIIPQEPVLFIGTVRYNLDPFVEHEDARLWGALEKAYMKEKISSLEEGLDSPVAEGGDNFSVGERQLLCMARALLRNSKILFLDEATAAIDTETDSLIQETIRSAFSDCTTLTIAHRLNTVLDSDRILVMDDGKIAEFDSPSVLRSNPTSVLSGLIRAVDSQKITQD